VAHRGRTLQPAQAATAPVSAALITVNRLQVELQQITDSSFHTGVTLYEKKILPFVRFYNYYSIF
jgi:hypothetical protein